MGIIIRLRERDIQVFRTNIHRKDKYSEGSRIHWLPLRSIWPIWRDWKSRWRTI